MAAAWTSAFGSLTAARTALQGVRASDRAEHTQQGALLGGRRLRQAGFHLADTGGRIRCLQTDRAQGLLRSLQILGTACLGRAGRAGPAVRSGPASSPSFFTAAMRSFASESRAASNRAGMAAVMRRRTMRSMAVMRRARSAGGQHLHDRGIHFLAGKGGEAFLGRLGNVLGRHRPAIRASTEKAEALPISASARMAASRTGSSPLAGGGRQGRQGRSIAALGEGLDHQDLPVGRESSAVHPPGAG